jgi:hypothetical protein
MTTRKRKALVGAAVTIIVFVACLDNRSVTMPEAEGPMAAHSVAPFACQVEFVEESTIQDPLLATYDIASHTDTSYVCASWTGSDYRVFTEQIGSSVAPEFREAATTSTYDGGVVSTVGADPEAVGPTAFDMGLATPAEVQAS